MKKCPYCAEEIQDAAIVCKHCGRELDTDAVAKVSSTPQAPPQIEETAPTFSVDGVEMLYTGLLVGIRKLKPKEIQRYPLGVDRRPRVIAEGMVPLFDKQILGGVILSIWWNHSADPRMIKKKKADDWPTMAKKELGINRSDSKFPTEDEWLSIVAAVLVAVNQTPRVSALGMMDMIDVWRSLANANRADRILRGITILGTMANLATAFSAPKPPKQGKFQWHAWRRACAQVEASSLLLVE